MQPKKKLLIIMPAYNEEQNIERVIRELREKNVFSYADVLVMNDASSDRTEEIVRENGIHVIRHVYHLGYGCGLQIGYKYAVKNQYEYLIQMDADGQHDVCNIETIYAALQEKDEMLGGTPDIVLGSRFRKDSYEYPVSPLKKLAIQCFRSLIFLGTRKRYTDPTTGLQGLGKRAFTFYSGFGNFDDQYPDANMILQMTLLGYRIKEVPAVMHMRTDGVSMHSGWKPILYMFRMFFSILAVLLRVKLLKMDKKV